LKKFGWEAPTGNVPAAYLTGLLCGLKAKIKGVSEAILDVGLVSPSKGSRLYAVLSGVLDAGLAVPHDESKIVKERTKGEHIAEYGKSFETGSESHSAKFSGYLGHKLFPEKLPAHFAKVKAEVVGAFKKDDKKTSKKGGNKT
jgi:large subunit ribosomal protein L18